MENIPPNLVREISLEALKRFHRERDGDDQIPKENTRPLAEVMSSNHSIKILPPGLRRSFVKFISYCELAQRKKLPLMICGSSGVGKSMFVELYKKICLSEDPGKKIFTVNCSHFEGDLANSELFGHKIGAFTGASQEHEGWLKKADGGVLVLEEIGELSGEVQAKLLTFVETGEFHKVGSTEIERSNVLFVGATNNELSLRDDFRYRFFPFYIPPLYKRREDILYYFAIKFPDLLPILKPFEILTLLAYNWPGNVRELERVGNLLTLKRLNIISDSMSVYRYSILETSEEDETDLMVKGTLGIYLDLHDKGYSAKDVEKYLNRGFVGIAPGNNECFYKSFTLQDMKIMSASYNNYGVVEVVRSRVLEMAFRMGLIYFCTLFYQGPRENKNLLQIHKGNPIFFTEDMMLNELSEIARRNKGFQKLEKMILSYLGNIELPETIQIPSTTVERVDFLGKLAEMYPQSSIFKRARSEESSGSKTIEPDVWSMAKAELVREYYSRLLKKTGGNAAEAARMAGEKYTTFRSSLKRYGVKTEG